MIKKLIYIIMCVIFLFGCNERISLEDTSLVLIIGIDKSNEGNLIVGTSIAQFNNRKNKITIEDIVEAPSIYSGFSKITGTTTGFLTSAKAQIILVGKDLAKEEYWVNELDPIVRDPYSSSNVKVLVVDGTIKEIFNLRIKESDSLPTYINELITSSIHDNRTVSSSIQELIRQQNEEGMTQSMPFIKGDEDKIGVNGIAFLNHKGKYVTHISAKETSFYNLLNNKKNQGRMILHLEIKPSKHKRHQIVTVLVEKAKRKIDVVNKAGKFHFNIDIDLDLAIIEQTKAKYSTNKQQDETLFLENQIKEQVNKQLISIINKIQKNELDPLGLSMYARAYHYKKWEMSKKDWVKELSKSDINITTNIRIQNAGVNRE